MVISDIWSILAGPDVDHISGTQCNCSEKVESPIGPSPLGCENNDRCLCDMSLSYENGDAAITIGEDNEIEKTVRVENSGSEPAYNAKLLIQTDQMITPPRQCTTSLESSESRVV